MSFLMMMMAVVAAQVQGATADSTLVTADNDNITADNDITI